MLIFTTTFLPMNFCTKTLSIPWLPLPLYYLLLLCRSSHLCCQHHSFLLTMPCLIITPTSAATGVAPKVIGVPTATVTLSRTGDNLLQIGGQTTGSRPGATPALGSGLDSSMYAANCAPVSVTQLLIVHSFTKAFSILLLTLLLGIFLLRLGSPTWHKSTSHLILELWLILHPILVMIICMLVTVRTLTYSILDILHYIPQNACLPYLMFSICLTLPNCCYLFKNSAVIITFILNFTLLCFMWRISSPRKFSFSVKVMMVFISSPSLLPRQFLKLFGLLASSRLPTCGIFVWVIQLLTF